MKQQEQISLKIKDYDLAKKLKIQARIEEKTIYRLVESALKLYLSRENLQKNKQ